MPRRNHPNQAQRRQKPKWSHKSRRRLKRLRRRQPPRLPEASDL